MSSVSTNCSPRPGALVLAICVALGWMTAPARAQTVQRCLIEGHTVYQSSPCAPEQSMAAPAIPRAAASAVVEAPTVTKKRTLADLLRERDAADQGQQRAKEVQHDGAQVLRARMGAL